MVQAGTIERCRLLFTRARASTTIEICRVMREKIDALIHYFTVKWQQPKEKPNAASAAERMKIFNFYPRVGLAGTVGDPSRSDGSPQGSWAVSRTDQTTEQMVLRRLQELQQTGSSFLEHKCDVSLPSLHYLHEALLTSCYYKITRLEKKCSPYFVKPLLNIISQLCIAHRPAHYIGLFRNNPHQVNWIATAKRCTLS